jgi:hypothetical protein
VRRKDAWIRREIMNILVDADEEVESELKMAG